MQSRLETLRRLAGLYAAVEEMHAAELQRIAGAVLDARNAIGVEREKGRLARWEGREALQSGDHAHRIISETAQETAAWRRQKLEEIRIRREQLNDAAREQYVASRLKREQIQRVSDEIAARLEIEEGRRAQATSDDRYLARRRWTDVQNEMREDQQMKVS
jgi:hypothetical protein